MNDYVTELALTSCPVLSRELRVENYAK
jgi:hypothetical protein